MAVNVMIPTALKGYTNNEDKLKVDGANISDVFAQLTVKYPELKPHLIDDEGALRNFVNVFVNEDNIRDQQNMETVVKDGDEVVIVPAIAGGAIRGRRHHQNENH